MRYALSKIRQYEEEMAYRCYVTDALKSAVGLNMRYVEAIQVRPVKEETRTPDEIVNEVRRRINGFIQS